MRHNGAPMSSHTSASFRLSKVYCKIHGNDIVGNAICALVNTYGIAYWKEFLKARGFAECPACFVEAEIENAANHLEGHKTEEMKRRRYPLEFDYYDDFDNPLDEWDDGDPGPRKELI